MDRVLTFAGLRATPGPTGTERTPPWYEMPYIDPNLTAPCPDCPSAGVPGGRAGGTLPALLSGPPAWVGWVAGGVLVLGTLGAIAWAIRSGG